MGARGPTPKDPQRRQRPKAGEATAVDLTLLPSRFAVPDPPDGLLASTRHDWDEFWGSDLARTVQDTDVPALMRLFRYRDEWARLWAITQDADFEPFALGSTKQTKMHPVYDQLEKLESRILALEDRYGLNLRQRFALGATAIDTQKSLAQFNDRYRDGKSASTGRKAPLDLATDQG